MVVLKSLFSQREDLQNMLLNNIFTSLMIPKELYLKGEFY